MWLAGDYLPNPVPNTDFDEFVEERALGLVGGNVVTCSPVRHEAVMVTTFAADQAKRAFLHKFVKVGVWNRIR